MVKDANQGTPPPRAEELRAQAAAEVAPRPPPCVPPPETIGRADPLGRAGDHVQKLS